MTAGSDLRANLGKRLARLGRSAPPLAVLVLLAAILWLGEYANRGLWEPDEARYAYIAREMRETGQWLVPHRFGEIYAHKPPLIFWLINGASIFTGGRINGLSARLPSLLGAIMTLWALSRLAMRWSGAGTAWLTVFILCTSYLFWHEGGTGQIDSLLCGLEMTALYFLFRQAERPSLRDQVISYTLMGFAILAKGPVGLIIPLGIFATAQVVGGKPKTLKGWHWLWGPAWALCFPAAWLAAAWWNGAPGAYFHEILFDQNVNRAAGALGHVKPWYYFLVYLPLDFLPWTLLLPAAFMALVRNPLPWRSTGRLLGWILFPLLFFSLIASKRNIYILPVYPALAMLLAMALPHIARLPRKWQVSSGFLFSSLLLAGGIAGTVAGFLPQWPGSPWTVLPTSLLLVAGSLLVATRAHRYGLAGRFPVLAAATLFCAQLATANILLPAFDSVKTPHRLADAARSTLDPHQPLLIYQMNGEILALYSNRTGERLDSPEALLAKVRKMEHGIVVMHRHTWKHELSHLRGIGSPHAFQLGDKKLVWLEFGST